MKTPTAQPEAKKPGHSYDIATWLTVLVGVAALVRLGIVIARQF